MKRWEKIFVCTLAGIGLTINTAVVASDIQDAGYHRIVDRNAFCLSPPASSKNVHPATSVIARPRVALRGITTILEGKLAFLMMPASKPGGFQECLQLTEGQAQNKIQVKEIDEKGGIVKIINNGEAQTLDFRNDGDESPDIAIRTSEPKPVVMPGSPLTPEQHAIVIESERLKAMQDGDPVAKILPPTKFTDEITGEKP